MKKLNKFLQETTKEVDSAIKDILNLETAAWLRKAVNYQISMGGKRMRPAFLIASCRLLGGSMKDAIYPAAGIEILHNYSLIVDDIIDNSEIRRGEATLWKKYGKDIAQCVGISYAASIFQAINHSPEISQLYSKAIKEIVEGEILDILYERAGREDEPYVTEKRYKEIGLSDYLRMIKKKTAYLCQVSCQAGAIIANAPQKEVNLLSSYGFNTGIAFQIQDDILDIFGKEESFGKEIGKDIKERKGGNIIIVLALEEMDRNDSLKLLKIFEKRVIGKNDLSVAIDLIKKTKAKERASIMAERYIKKAEKSLEMLPDNEWRKMLDSLAKFVISRNK